MHGAGAPLRFLGVALAAHRVRPLVERFAAARTARTEARGVAAKILPAMAAIEHVIPPTARESPRISRITLMGKKSQESSLIRVIREIGGWMALLHIRSCTHVLFMGLILF